jgi:ABC-type polysaccharide/polyol phosphate transport system ATPase subunit
VAERPAAGTEDAVVLDSVRVAYRLPLDPGLSLKEAFVRRRRRRFVEHLAIDGLDLVVKRGEALGIIGANGAGKTTLLKVVARVLHPTSGRVRVTGRVSPLLDLLGAFHPELTGRENAFLAGTLLGLSGRESAARFPAIEAFAEIGAFVDAPLRTYSSGMMLRLAFAVATTVDADVLAVDEALAVGDAAFQEKCAERIQSFRARGVTFLVVSHDVLRLRDTCDRVLWLEHGRQRGLGPAGEVVGLYLEGLHG